MSGEESLPPLPPSGRGDTPAVDVANRSVATGVASRIGNSSSVLGNNNNGGGFLPFSYYPAVSFPFASHQAPSRQPSPVATLPGASRNEIPPPTKKTSTTKDMRFTKEEEEYLGEILVEILPIGQRMWEEVTNRFNQMFPTRARQTENLRRKFNTLHKKKIPTGDPTMPKAVRLCKKANALIIQASQLSTCNSDEDDDDEEEVELEEQVEPKQTAVSDLENYFDDDEASRAEENKGASSAVAASATSSSKKKAAKKKKIVESSAIDKYMKVVLLKEKLKDKREARKERKRDKKEKRKERKDRRKDRLLLTMVATAVAAFSGKNTEGNGISKELFQESSSSSSSSSSSDSCSSDNSSIESMSSIDSKDSPPTKKRKKKMLKKKKVLDNRKKKTKL